MPEDRPGAAAWVPGELSLTALREAAQGCRGCELYRDATQAVMGDGDPRAGLMLLGGTAGKAVYGSGFKVGESRGRLQEWPVSFAVAQPPAWVLATNHPSAVLRADDRRSAYEALVADLRVAADRLMDR